MESFKLAAGIVCSKCGIKVDEGTPVSGLAIIPPPGAFSVCFYCGHLTILTEENTLRNLTSEEQVAVRANIKTWATICRVRHFASLRN